MARPLFDSEYLFGLHEPGGEQIMLQAGKAGWILFTEEIGHEPNNRGGKNFSRWSNQGLGILCRLNNGYEPNGTIPHSSQYANFAKRCANYVQASSGCKIWIIGNEMNYHVERPPALFGPSAAPAHEAQPDEESRPKPPINRPISPLGRIFRRFLSFISGGMGSAQLFPEEGELGDPRKHGAPERFSAINQPDAPSPFETLALPEGVSASAAPIDGREVITPDLYAKCYRLCREAIHSVPGHADDQVLVGPVAPWNAQTKYGANQRGDWVQYLTDVLTALGPDSCDGVAIHTYTHGSDTNLIRSEQKLGGDFQDRRFEFRAYRDFMHGIPQNMRHLPVYITETDENIPWVDQNSGWVQQAYGEIDAWNRQQGNQQIRSLILYRWPRRDRWVIEGKQGVINDFREALKNDYRWRVTLPPAADWKKGDMIRTTDTVNMRRSPGYVGKPANDVVAQIPQGTTLELVGTSSRVVDSLIWWNLKGNLPNGRSVTGWLAQFAPNGLPLLQKVTEQPKPPSPPPGSDLFKVGDVVRTLNVVRMRNTPGFRNKPSNDVIAGIQTGVDGTVVDGPHKADGLIWWQVRTTHNGRTVVGWMAESVGGNQLLQKAPPANNGPTTGPQLQKGGAAKTLTIVRMRNTPGFRNKPRTDVLLDVQENQIVRVLDGPRSADGLTWWQVQAKDSRGRSVIGWMAAALSNGVALLEPAADTPPPPPPKGTFKKGQRVQTTNLVRIRKSPGLFDKPADDVITDVGEGTIGTILDGPRNADDLIWWRVRFPNSRGRTMQGWMAEVAPNGVKLLRAAPPSGPGGGSGGKYAVGELLVAKTALRVRKTPGFRNKPGDDVLGAYQEKATLNIVDDDSRQADGLTWWRVGGITPTGEAIGWVAESFNGNALIGDAAKLPGTSIPDKERKLYLGAPTERPFGTAQLFGENPDFYKRFKPGGVPLRGHNGIDFLTPVGTRAVATENGQVIFIGNDPNGFGNWLLLQHAWGRSIYAHMDSIAVQNGQNVQRGQFIGRSGNSGASTGPHLHFAIALDPWVEGDGWGGFSDPLPYIPPEFVILPPYVKPIAAAVAPLGAPSPEDEMQVEVVRDEGRPFKRLAPSAVTVEMPE